TPRRHPRRRSGARYFRLPASYLSVALSLRSHAQHGVSKGGRRRSTRHPSRRALRALLRMRASLDTLAIIHSLPSAFLKAALPESSRMAQRIVDVLVPVALDHAYSYRAPPELDLHV